MPRRGNDADRTAGYLLTRNFATGDAVVRARLCLPRRGGKSGQTVGTCRLSPLLFKAENDLGRAVERKPDKSAGLIVAATAAMALPRRSAKVFAAISFAAPGCCAMLATRAVRNLATATQDSVALALHAAACIDDWPSLLGVFDAILAARSSCAVLFDAECGAISCAAPGRSAESVIDLTDDATWTGSDVIRALHPPPRWW